MIRSTCPKCHKHPVAINYYRKEKVHYRTMCTPCLHKKKKFVAPGWFKSGYKKTKACDRCGFKFKLAEQGHVYYIDGNINNNNWVNLKTICLNCQVEVAKTRWKPSTLTPDF